MCLLVLFFMPSKLMALFDYEVAGENPTTHSLGRPPALYDSWKRYRYLLSCGCDSPSCSRTTLGIHTPDLRWSQSHPILDDTHGQRRRETLRLTVASSHLDGIAPFPLDAKKAGFAPLQSKSLIVAWKKAVHMLLSLAMFLPSP